MTSPLWLVCAALCLAAGWMNTHVSGIRAERGRSAVFHGILGATQLIMACAFTARAFGGW